MRLRGRHPQYGQVSPTDLEENLPAQKEGADQGVYIDIPLDLTSWVPSCPR